MSTFALVHGAWHGGWCWERLVPELESRGHRVVTMDLPCDDNTASFDDYADTVCTALADVTDDDLVVVGHSLAGLTIPLVATRRPVRRLVYLCALLPLAGRSLRQQMADDVTMLDPGYTKGLAKTGSGQTTWVDEELSYHHLFGDCDEATATAAFARLRPQATFPYTTPAPTNPLPTVESTYVVCTEDRIVNPEWSRRAAPDRLNGDLIELPGSHSPFYSRPAQVAELLDQVARS